MWMTPASLDGGEHALRALGTVLASGFSQSTALPARAAAIAISACESPGVQTSTMSMSSPLTTSRQSVAASSQPSARGGLDACRLRRGRNHLHAAA